ncbi:MurR/RpiR family transcriptional regulator [Halomonas litopenaei]|uniref:MurR/RpiR family transcriptional regulator n=1 Tax=Halomonas litopenaei TaxID=2109328 RepID=UPI003FA0BA77
MTDTTHADMTHEQSLSHEQSLEARLRAHHQDLPPAERRLAELLLNFPGDISRYSAGELAEAAGTSRAAASRLFRRLGYRDFNEARQQVRDAQRWGSPLYLSSATEASRPAPGDSSATGQDATDHGSGSREQGEARGSASPGGAGQGGTGQRGSSRQPSARGTEGQALSRGQGAQGGLTADSALGMHLAQEQDNLARSFAELDQAALGEAITALGKAPRVHLAGFRNSQMLASFFHRQLQLLRPDVQLLPRPGQTLGEDLVDVGADDLVILIALRRRTGQETRLLDSCRQQGAKTLLLVDPTCPTALAGDWRLEARVASASPFDSYASCLSMIQAICTMFYRQNIDSCQQRLREVEALHDSLDELSRL